MEIILLLAIGIVIGIPTIAIVALVRSGTARRRVEESWYKILDLEGDTAGLRRELARLSERVAELEAPRAAPRAEDREANRETATHAVGTASAAAGEVNTVPVESSQPAVASSRLEQRAIPLRISPEAAPTPTASFETDRFPAHAEKAVIKLPAQAGVVKEKEVAPAATAPAEQLRAAPRPDVPPAIAARLSPPIPSFAAYEPAVPRESIFHRLKMNLPLEQFLGMNLFAKIGIVLLVLGLALLGRIALIAMGPGMRVALIYLIAAAMLGGGIWLECRERYRLLGRTGIGGGWALLFFTTYAMHHVAPMTVISSNTLDCILMLIVAVAMVAHTLRYRSQLVTGLAFLLGFSTVALSQDTVYALVAGVILALGIAVIALRMSWFELEIFGILASYANHFYWLYRLYPNGTASHAFPEFWPSAIILVLYWAIFRISYVARRVASPRQESFSTVAALANTMLLLAVMKFQSTHPELAFYALLGIGGLEFIFGQLPLTRRRQAAFTLLTVVGTLLIFAAVPFKFSGNNIALFWMIAAEALLIAGITQWEILFRRLGLIAGGLTGLLIVYEAQGIIELRGHSEALLLKDGILLLTSSALFYLNALHLRERWKELFGNFDSGLATAQNHLGCITAFLGVWALFTSDWTVIGWAAMMLGAAFGARFLKNKSLLLQAWVLSMAVIVRAAVFNWHFDDPFPHHLAMRILTLPLLALVFYCTRWVLSDESTPSRVLRSVSLWAGTALLASLASVELPVAWIAPAWAALAVVLCLLGRRFRLRDLTFQEHVLASAAAVALFAFNLETNLALDRYLPLMGCAAAFYAVSRFSTQRDATYRKSSAWLHTWTATALLAALAWHESPQPWLAVFWILFALALAIVDRVYTLEELPWQAHTLALLAAGRAVTLNFFITDKQHGVDLRLITVSILVAALYGLARWVRIPKSLENTDARHAYTWVGSGFAAWLLWCELQPISVAPGLGILALLLFETGAWGGQKQIRLQAYTLLAASFVRIFLVNLSAATLPGELISPRIYTVVPLTIICFYVWSRLTWPGIQRELSRWSASNLIAYFGAGTVVALLYYQLAPEWIIVGWALVVVALMTASLVLDKEVFLEQTALLTAGTVVRGLAHNIFGSSYFVSAGWHGKFSVLSLTSALLFAALPIAFQIRSRYRDRPRGSLLVRYLAARRPDQTLFFAPLLLIVVMIAIKMDPGMVTLAWGIVGLSVILIGLLASQRSYRLTGLTLLLLCIGKIGFRDAWQLDERSRYITFIVLGAALILVSALYSKYRDQVSRLL
ncbi:MAG TPA: DUF2339 domain-containing protein [Terracidiphilus sp.]|nr:DUF2339 domain-containing protein [Terracidiphilus sp.]